MSVSEKSVPHSNRQVLIESIMSCFFVYILVILFLETINGNACFGVDGALDGLYSNDIRFRNSMSHCPYTKCVYLYGSQEVYMNYDMSERTDISFKFDYKITQNIYRDNDWTTVYFQCDNNPKTIGYTVQNRYNNAVFQSPFYNRGFNLPSYCDGSSNVRITIQQFRNNNFGSINMENMCLGGYTEPTTAPTMVTLSPTPNIPIQNVNDVTCKDLGLSYNIIYDDNYDECVYQCKIDSKCIMINYLKYFKTLDDSRCYMYDDICQMKPSININQSIIGYDSNYFSCTSYPINWRDTVGDSCSQYNEYNWCLNGKPNMNYLNNIYAFEKNGLDGIDVCCNCGGGVYNYDDITLFYFNDNNIKRFDNNDLNTYGLNMELQIKSWNNLMLYDIMNNNNIDQSSNFDDLLFLDSNKLYNIYLCELNNNIQYISDYFIYIKQNNNIFINKHWSNIKESSFINLIPYLECLDKINFILPLLGVSSVEIASVYNIDPTTLTELKDKKRVPYKAGFISVMIIMILLIIILTAFIGWYFYEKRLINLISGVKPIIKSNTNDNQSNDTPRTEGSDLSMTTNISEETKDDQTEASIDIDHKRKTFKLKCFVGNNNEHIFVYVKKTDRISVVKMLIEYKRNKNNNINCTVSSIETLTGTKLSDDNKTLQDYGINKRDATVIVKSSVAAGGNNTAN